MARRNTLSVNLTITTLDAALARLLEPRAPRPDLRLATLAKLAAAGIHAGVFPNPVMPWITDTPANLDAVAGAARAAGAEYFGGGPLFLMPCAQQVFYPFLDEHFPHLAEPYRAPVWQTSLSGWKIQGGAAPPHPGHSRAPRPGRRARSLPAGTCPARAVAPFLMDLADFDYHLPEELIAQEPLADRAASRMLVLHRAAQRVGGPPRSATCPNSSARATAWC